MPLNLVSDAWIPVIDRHGQRRIIAPWQIADQSLLRPDWPRADLNVACLELLIGLVFLADPPSDVEDWQDRRAADPDRLRDRLAALAPAFNLTGDGPLFLQDLESLAGEASSADMLFIDSSGGNTAKNNADLMVRRGRYPVLDLPFAAMALFAFQSHAPSGGAGNRTSMRGGGPLVTLVDPGHGLWSLIWANVPDGVAQTARVLPWTRATRVSDTSAETQPPPGHAISAEAFFGMPRRLRLVEGEGGIIGVIQRPYGTNYGVWQHPLTPYYRQKPGTELLPVHPRAGQFGYRHWLGVLANGRDGDTKQRAQVLRAWRDRQGGGAVIVAGWAMDNMKPRDFTHSVQPFVALEGEAEVMLVGLIEAAEQAGLALRAALEPLLGNSEAREAEREAFYVDTEAAFHLRLGELALKPPANVAATWLTDLRAAVIARFEALALPGLDQREIAKKRPGIDKTETRGVERIIEAHRQLTACFRGYGKYGGDLFDALMMNRPAKKGKAA